MDYLLGGALGGLVAFVFSIPAIVLEFTEKGDVKNAPLVVDVKTIFGYKLNKNEAFLVGLFLYILIGILFGAVYVLFATQGWLFVTHAPYTFLSLVVYAFLSWIVAGVLIYPVLQMGLFGKKEGHHVWLETLVSHFILGVCLWLLIQYYQPYYFVF
jgi:hypothetical protein